VHQDRQGSAVTNRPIRSLKDCGKIVANPSPTLVLPAGGLPFARKPSDVRIGGDTSGNPELGAFDVDLHLYDAITRTGREGNDEQASK
jgi:hypothetical protein